MTKRKGIHAHTWAIIAMKDELEQVHEMRDALLDALSAKLLQIPEHAITDITARRLALTDADYIELAERNAGIDDCMLVGKITDVIKGRYTSISLQESVLMCRRAGLRPQIVFNGELIASGCASFEVVDVKPIAPLTLRVQFADGTAGKVKFEESHITGVFATLRDQDVFAQVHVSDGAVTWPGDIDLAPDAMYWAIKAEGEWVLS